MPMCRICEKPFPNRVVIEGKERNLSNRRYCLDCSPFQLHNTRQRHLPSPLELGVKFCPRCKQEKDGGQFYRRRDGSDFSPYCKPCTSDETGERMRKFKCQCVEYKGGKCEVCGYNKSMAALDFHHRDPKEKDFGIATARVTAFSDKVRKELDKCVLLCSNCHREEHERIASEMDITKACEALVPGSNPG